MPDVEVVKSVGVQLRHLGGYWYSEPSASDFPLLISFTGGLYKLPSIPSFMNYTIEMDTTNTHCSCMEKEIIIVDVYIRNIK